MRNWAFDKLDEQQVLTFLGALGETLGAKSKKKDKPPEATWQQNVFLVS